MASKMQQDINDSHDFFVETIYGAATKQPLVKISYDNKALCMINPKEAVLLAINLIQAANASITDAFLFEYMQTLGVRQQEAAAMMGEFRQWRMNKDYDLGNEVTQSKGKK